MQRFQNTQSMKVTANDVGMRKVNSITRLRMVTLLLHFPNCTARIANAPERKALHTQKKP